MDISGYNKATLLAILYNRARPQGMGFLHYDPTPWTDEDAQAYIDKNGLTFDYVKGRVMKVDISRNTLETGLYNRDNGANAAENALRAYIQSGQLDNATILDDQHNSTEAAKRDLKNNFGQPMTQQTTRGVTVFNLGYDPETQAVLEERLKQLP